MKKISQYKPIILNIAIAVALASLISCKSQYIASASVATSGNYLGLVNDTTILTISSDTLHCGVNPHLALRASATQELNEPITYKWEAESSDGSWDLIANEADVNVSHYQYRNYWATDPPGTVQVQITVADNNNSGSQRFAFIYDGTPCVL